MLLPVPTNVKTPCSSTLGNSVLLPEARAESGLSHQLVI
jgi:hypothetical protein